ncbi:MAG TPA: DUF4340 domain-containing protein [Candidatus Caccousia avistercoris]|nr:DUF4340 domain-containing protein [Candidatus Caccousia avistercoris]
MKKNTKYLALALGCVVVLGGAVAALTLTGGSGEDTASSSAASTAETIPLIDKTEEDLASVTITNEQGSFTIHARTETTVESVASGSSEAPEETTQVVYSVDELDGLTLDDSAVEGIAGDAYSLNAQKDIGVVEDLSEFGLDPAAATVSATFQDGTTVSYQVGIESGSNRYVKMSDSDNVYLAYLDDGILGSVNDLADTAIYELEVAQDDSEAASNAAMAGVSSEYAIINELHLSGTAFEQEVTMYYEEGTGYMLSEPRQATADSTKASDIATALTSLSADSLVKYHPTEEDLQEYGLAEPAVVCEFTANGQPETHTISVSAVDGDGNRYLMYGGIDAVWLVSNDTVTAWADADPFYLQSTLNLMPNIVTVETMTLTLDGQEYKFTLQRQVDEEESTEDSTEYIYTVTNADGLELDYEENFKHFYLTFISILTAEDYDQMPTGEPYLTCTYTYFDEEGSDTIEFYKVSDRRYAIVENGDLKGLALSDTVDLAAQNLQLLNSGEEVPDPN